jgi:hypothetical protein
MKRAIPFVVRTSIAAVTLVLLGWLLGLVFPADQVTEEATGVVGRFVLPLLSAFLLAAPLAFPISRSRLSGRALLGVVFLAVFGLTTVLTQVEVALFLNMTPRELLIETLKLTVTSLALAWLAVALYPRPGTELTSVEHGPNPPTTASWARRWIGVSFAYVVLYVTAGLLILPIIRSWYEAQGTLEPNPALVFPLQIARGALFVAFVIPLLRSMSVTRRQAAVAMAVMIPLVHGVAALIPPNPFMPAYVRHAHMIEIGWSNFVLGLLIGFLFWNPLGTAEAPTAT